MFGGFLVAAFHIEEGEIGMNELFFGRQFFSFVTLKDGAGIIAFSVISHSQGELGIKVGGIGGED